MGAIPTAGAGKISLVWKGGNMNTIYTAAQLMAGVILLAVEGVALWLVIEGAYWLFCKATGRAY